MSSKGKLQISAFTSAIGLSKSDVVYSKFFCFLKISKKHCSGAMCNTFSFSLDVKKSVSSFKNNHINLCLSNDNVDGESAFSRCFPYP